MVNAYKELKCWKWKHFFLLIEQKLIYVVYSNPVFILKDCCVYFCFCGLINLNSMF
jgi:hypothetical protein